LPESPILTGFVEMQNYMIADAAGTTAAVIMFAFVFLPPGFVAGVGSDVLGFRRRSASERLLFSVVLSTATTPILAVLVGHFVSVTASLAVLLLLTLIAVALIGKELFWSNRSLPCVPRSTWIGLTMMAMLSLLAILSVIDLQFGDRLYLSAAIFDHSVRIPFVEAAARSGVPPLNPFYGLGKTPVLRYYYYWYVVCALPERRSGLSARACFNASVVWSGLALAATIPLYLKHFFRETEALRRKSLLGICLLTVTGLDLIPYSVLAWKGTVSPDLEWWDPNQVTSWLDSLIWVPHHVAALTACMAGFLLLSTLDEQAGVRERGWAAVIAGIAFASAAGLSVYVTLSFAVFAGLWSIILLGQRHIRDFTTYATAGVIALLLSLPYLGDIGSKSTTGQRFVIFAIRDFPNAIDWLRGVGVHGPALDFAKLPILLIVYFVEFGFFFCVAVLRLKRELLDGPALSQQRRAAWVMLASCLVLVSILQSDPGLSGGNDLGFRGMLVVQFVLLLWAVPLMHDILAKQNSASGVRPIWKVALVGTLLLGVLGTSEQLLMLRCYALLVDSGKIHRSESYMGLPEFGRRTYKLREGVTQLEHVTTTSTILQYNPLSENAFLIHLYSSRQVVAGDATCGSNFGGDAEKCREAMPYLSAIFESPADARGWNLDRFCDTYSLNLLVATEADRVWYDPGSWVWNRDAVVSNDSLRAIPCGWAYRHHKTLSPGPQ